MIFWTTVIIVTLIISIIAFYPLLRKSIKTDSNQRDQLNKAFYFERLKELEKEVDEGVIDDPEKTKIELQQSLLDDIPEQSSASPSVQKSVGKSWFIVLILLVGSVSTGIYFSVGSWFTDSVLESNHQKLNEFYQRVENEQSEPLSTEEMNQFAMALRVELQKKADDHKLWFMLGQVGIANNNGQLALDSFAKASQLQPENTQYKLKYAQILMFSDDPNDKAKGEAQLKEVIRSDHTNVDALSLLAFRSFEQEDYKMAAMTWGMMLRLLPENDSRIGTIERSIQSARAMMKEQESQNKNLQKGEQ